MQRNVEGWYDAAMNRVAGAYKRYALQVVFALGLIVAAVSNVDSVALVNSISTSSKATDLAGHLPPPQADDDTLTPASQTILQLSAGRATERR